MRFLTKTTENFEADTVICFIYENDDTQSKLFKKLNKLSNEELKKQVYDYKSTTGSFMDIFKYSIDKDKRVLVCGLGKKEELTRKKFSQIVANATRCAKRIKTKVLGIELIEKTSDCECILSSFNSEDAAKIIFTAARIGLYEFDKYLPKNENKTEIIELICAEETPKIEKGAQIGAYTSFAMKFAKDLVNESAQIVTPCYVAKIAQEIANEHKLEAKIYNKKEIKEMKMNAFLAVGQGSVNEPQFDFCTMRKHDIRKCIQTR